MSKYKNLVIFIVGLSYSLTQEPSVLLPQGRIIGTKVYTERSREPVDIYYGIPYAIPPVGKYRFSAPERHPGWKRTFQAHRSPPPCPQRGDGGARSDSYYSEDCLYLNIWTPWRADGSAAPVVVILYGESWSRGGVALPCQDLAAEGLVVVTVQYRLHVLGFFTLRSVSARGNLALLDQYLAMLWVRDNVGSFGGDPAAITVLGHSAGADSVLHHLASPRSKGLFRRAVVMSPREIWKLIDERRTEETTGAERVSREIAYSLGCRSKKDQELLQCMRALPLSDILSAYSNTNWTDAMSPITESYLPQAEQYLPTSLLSSLGNADQPIHVDLLFGTTALEALNHNDEVIAELLNRNVSYVSEHLNSKVIPEILRIFNLQISELLVRAILWEYGSDKSSRSGSLSDAIELVSRIESSAKWVTAGALVAARLARRLTRLYAYRYSEPATVDLRGNHFNFSGAVHGSDLISLLGDALMLQVARRPATTQEKLISVTFRRYITNFIKYGTPENAGKWQRYRAGDAHIFEIHNENIIESNDANKDVKFWLQYLPELSNLHKVSEETGQLTLERDDGRLRGGVFAMCGVAVGLLFLLIASAILLQRQRSRRRLSITEG